MALKKITPIHMAIQTLDDTIKLLKLQRAELVATLPVSDIKRPDKMFITHPLTGEKHWIKER